MRNKAFKLALVCLACLALIAGIVWLVDTFFTVK